MTSTYVPVVTEIKILTAAGPSSAVQWVFIGGPYTTASPCAAVSAGGPTAAVSEAGDIADEDVIRAE